MALTVIAIIGSVLVTQCARPVLIPIVIGVLISYVLGPGGTHWPGMAFRDGRGGPGDRAALRRTRLRRLQAGAADSVDRPGHADRGTAAHGPHQDFASPANDSALETMQRAATEIDKAAADAAEPTPTQKGVTRVQIVEPAFRATDYLWAGGKNVELPGPVRDGDVPGLLPAADRRSLQTQAGEDCRADADEEKITVQIMDEINQQISGFLRVQVLTSALVGVLTAIALWYFGVRQYIIWGILAGIFNSIPYLGPLIVTGGLVVVFIQFDDLLKTAYICGITLAITSLEGWLLTPALMSRAAQMNPGRDLRRAAVLELGLGRGTILAVPMMMTAKAICDRIEDSCSRWESCSGRTVNAQGPTFNSKVHDP